MRTWQSHRPGQGARTDLTYLPSPNGQPVFINPTTITTATLLSDLTNTHATTITKKALQQRWTQQFPDDNHTPPLPQSPNTPTTRQLKKTLDALHKLGAIQHDRHHITIINHAILTHITTLVAHDSDLPQRAGQSKSGTLADSNPALTLKQM